MRKAFPLLLFTFVLGSCSAVSVRLDYDRKADFSSYSSYTFNPQMESGLSELDERRFLRLMDSVLQARGFEKKLLADLLIDVRSQVYTSSPSPNIGFGMGGTNAQMGGAVSVGIPAGGGGLRRQLDIAFFDFTTDRIVWEAQTEQGLREDVSPEKREELLRKVVIRALDQYPPRK